MQLAHQFAFSHFFEFIAGRKNKPLPSNGQADDVKHVKQSMVVEMSFENARALIQLL
jgi:hypothetical protein